MFVVCGEALYDMFVTGEGTNGQFDVDARAGGSPFNVALGMARQGAGVGLLTGLSTDAMGRRLAGMLAEEGVAAEYLVRTDRRTTLSVVDLGPDGGPAYAFYGSDSADCGLRIDDLPALGAQVTGLHFGSYSIAVTPVADALAALAARESHRFISLDPNVRPTIQSDMDVWKARIDHLRRLAGLVKVSDEDLGLLYPGAAPLDIARDWAAQGPEMVVVTGGAGDVLAVRGAETLTVSASKVDVVDTVGAGDTFQATLLAALGGHADPRAALSGMTRGGVEALLGRAAAAAAITCARRGADLPVSADIDGFLKERAR